MLCVNFKNQVMTVLEKKHIIVVAKASFHPFVLNSFSGGAPKTKTTKGGKSNIDTLPLEF